ncbi:hypothetical protein, partial [Cronobacter sakazakii]|uniref:hypothetical protein n=1 Tax=Cronobacter sakazakii TaxID=28141 RepID=UPI00211664ED
VTKTGKSTDGHSIFLAQKRESLKLRNRQEARFKNPLPQPSKKFHDWHLEYEETRAPNALTGFRQ